MPATHAPRFSLLPRLVHEWDVASRSHRLQAETPAALHAWRRRTRAKLVEITGYDRLRPVAAAARITETVQLEDHVRQRVEIQTEAGVTLPMFVLLPREGAAPFVPVLAPHGHGGGGKAAVAGLRDDPDVAAAIDTYNYDYGLQLVRAGYAVFCPDARGFGERQERRHHGKLDGSCQYINHMALPLGQTVTGMWAYELSRLIDYVKTRDDCVKDRVGCVGLSGGGLQTLWAAALDDRVSCAVISGYFYGYKQSLLELYTNCSCNYVPGLFELLDIGDIGALIAPRPVLIETGDDDYLNGREGVPNVKRQVAITRRAYVVAGARAALKHVVFRGEHRYWGEETLPWLERWLRKAPPQKRVTRPGEARTRR